ncbi:hypothetical protein ABW19_dt0210629 [Dactylella cylindrospora]|nr:hypothetical protein ABW19_dt0210629 [Dactylella cylindrospora]
MAPRYSSFSLHAYLVPHRLLSSHHLPPLVHHVRIHHIRPRQVSPIKHQFLHQCNKRRDLLQLLQASINLPRLAQYPNGIQHEKCIVPQGGEVRWRLTLQVASVVGVPDHFGDAPGENHGGVDGGGAHGVWA